MRRFLPIALLCLAPVSGLADELHVGAGRAFTSLRAALTAAHAGDSIIVHGGVYREGNLLVEKPVNLVGLDHPRLDGRATDEVLTITASNVSVRGFDVQNGGTSSLADVAGIKVDGANHVTIEDNRILDCNFGIYLAKARDGVVRNNEIRGASGEDQDNGNGIHSWYCERIEITGNRVKDHRDGIYLEFTTDSNIARNLVTGNLRYGLHFMFSHRNTYRENSFLRNGAGVAVMYSHDVLMEGNRFSRSWGSAAYGLLLRDISDSRITGNTFEYNSIAVTMQNSTRMHVERNVFRGNGWALQVQSSCNDNVFAGNDFIGNSFDLASNGQLELNRFDSNYWDKAETYDLDRDGVSDVPYRPISLFGMLVSRIPPSLLLLRSPLAHFLDRAERIFPSLTPDHLVDAKPAMHPHPL